LFKKPNNYEYPNPPGILGNARKEPGDPPPFIAALTQELQEAR